MALSNLTKVQTVGIGSNIEVVGVITTGQFKSGTSNLHSTGVELTNLNVSGIATIGGNLSIGGTLTYQDVTNIDSVGLITARTGIKDQTLTAGRIVYVDSDKTLTDSGNLTYNSNGVLNLMGASGNTQLALFRTNTNTTGTTGTIGFYASDNHAVAGLYALGDGNNEGAHLVFKTTSAASGTSIYSDVEERLRITSTGLVGMGGNTNPTNVLHIKTAVTNTAVATIESTATNSYPFLRLKNDAREYQLTCHGGLSDAFTIYDGTSSAHRFLIDSSGRVLINTTNNSNGHIAASNLAVQGADLSIFKDSGGDNAGVSGHKLKFVTQSGSLGEIDVLSEGGGGPSGRGGSMRFYTKENNTASAVERMRLTSTGALRIERGSDSSNAIVINSTSTTDACRIKFDESGSTKAQITYSHDNDRLELVASSGNSIAFYSGGNLVSQIDTSGHFIPQTNNVHDLGSSSKRWRNVYTTDLQLSNKGKTNDVDNTWGDYTIQEGESELFLINNRNGKKYKFNLTEVS